MPVYTEDELDWEDETTTIYCPFCEQRGYKNALGGKILMPGEVRPDDYENFLQCAVCYEVIPLHETYQDATISDVIEKSENPFEQGKTVIESLRNRTGKKIQSRSKAKRKKNVLHEDADINEEMRRHGEDRVKVVYDTNP